jgi:hypothetical protein
MILWPPAFNSCSSPALFCKWKLNNSKVFICFPFYPAETLVHIAPTIHHKGLAGDKIALVACKEQNRSGQVRRLLQAL